MKNELMKEWAHIPKTNPDLLGISFEDFLVLRISTVTDWFKDREKSMLGMEGEIKRLESLLESAESKAEMWRRQHNDVKEKLALNISITGNEYNFKIGDNDKPKIHIR